MGWDIVNQESKDPGKRSRLWKPEEISEVLKQNKGTEAVEAISFDRERAYQSNKMKVLAREEFLSAMLQDVHLRCLALTMICLQ
ncbi:hypothetical protein P8452_19905 [Trifolium repens]|nr:hypothetical protein P8452_19905 [Trifolium repens]